MADKAAIELGLRLHRLMESEDFAPLLAEWDSRIANRKSQLKVQGSSLTSDPVVIDRLTNRLDELEDFKDWVSDEIERGGMEKMKEQQAIADQENEAEAERLRALIGMAA